MESSFAKEIVIRDAMSLEDCDNHTAAGNMQDESGLRQVPRAMLILLGDSNGIYRQFTNFAYNRLGMI